MLPETLTPLAPEYQSLLEQVFREHVESGSDSDLDNFVDVQKTWDEIMGAKSAEFLRKNPDSVLVVLAGMRHIAHGHGIPARVENATGLSGTIVLTENERPHMPDGGDVYLAATSESLPENGRMGVYINDTGSGAVIAGFTDDSPAKEAGAEAEDIILRINGRKVDAFGDIKLELWDQLPGDAVVMVVRRGVEATLEEISFELY
jgi:membrane-associated protease RseP (regulator of RpoE activity)